MIRMFSNYWDRFLGCYVIVLSLGLAIRSTYPLHQAKLFKPCALPESDTVSNRNAGDPHFTEMLKKRRKKMPPFVVCMNDPFNSLTLNTAVLYPSQNFTKWIS